MTSEREMEEKKKEPQARVKRAKNGERKQKMFSFRADVAAQKVLEVVKNKGRFINEAIIERGHKLHYDDYMKDDDELPTPLDDYQS